MSKKVDAETLAFRHKARQYYIGCAKHVLDLAPLPEFRDAIAWLEIYDETPSDYNRKRLKKTYNALRSGQKWRGYGYTAVGEFYYGLLHIIYHALFKPDSMSSCDGQRFTEACYCAGCTIGGSTAFHSVSNQAQNAEYAWQQSLWDAIVNPEKKLKRIKKQFEAAPAVTEVA